MSLKAYFTIHPLTHVIVEAVYTERADSVSVSCSRTLQQAPLVVYVSC